MIEQPPHIEPSKPVADGKPNGNGSYNVIQKTQPKVKRTIGLVIVGALSIIAILAFIPSWIQKWRWMRQLNYAGIFWTLFSLRWGLFVAAFVVALLYLWMNFRLAMKNGDAIL
jgi:uncharacterized membrane protein